MKIRFNLLSIILTVGLSAGSVYSDDVNHFGTYTPDQFQDYWYNHGAEISRFTLQQMRYGEIHEGDAVLVFVTEEIIPALQVKADYPGTVYARLAHRPLMSQKVGASLDTVNEKKP